MDKRAVDAARKEYDRAAEAVSVIRTSPDFARVQNAWSAFLVANGRIFTKLEQGSKVSGKSSAWWGRKLRYRRTDPLLCYLRHARNTDEHTIEEITERHDTKTTTLEPKPEDVALLERALINRSYAPLALVEITWAHVRLLDVVDKGTRYFPPQKHLGSSLTDTSPANIAGLALTYLDSMLKEASELIS